MIAPNHDGDIDLIQELRLRKWARENYVPVAVRNDSEWHPIVLNEMQRKDVDIQQRELNISVLSSFVPLAPTVTHVIDGPHTEKTRRPHVAPARKTAEAWFSE